MNMNFSGFEQSKYSRVSVNLSKCDDLIKKCAGSEPLMGKDSETKNTQLKSLTDVKSNYQKNPVSKTMSIKGVFNVAIREVQNLEPKEFCLPSEYLKNIDLNVAVAEKDPEGFINDMDSNDLMRLPPRKCYYCKRICSDGEIISCDFCPGNFHINCLNPPLCSIPDVRWMCPLHPQRVLDKVMDSSCSISELTAWWNKIAAPTNDKDVEMDFLDKIKLLRNERLRKNPIKCSSKIPDIVKYHYEHPSTGVSLLQELTNFRQDCVSQDDSSVTSHETTPKLNNCSFDAVKNDHMKLDCHQRTKGSTEDYSPRQGTMIEIVSEDNPRVVEDSNKGTSIADENTSEDLSVWDRERKTFKFKSYGIYDYDSVGLQCSDDTSSSETKTSSEFKFSPACSKKLSQQNSKNSSWRRIREIINHGFQNSSTEEKQICNGNGLTNRLKERLKKMKFHSITKNFPPSFRPNTLPYPYFWSSLSENALLPRKPLKKTHAVLCPLSHQAPPVFMYNNTLNIGTDTHDDVHLTSYGNCNFLSKQHATIFLDEYTKTYELLNYSEFGCVVDGLHYTNNLSAETCSTITRKREVVIGTNVAAHQGIDRKIISAKKTIETDEGVRKRRLVTSSDSSRLADRKRVNSNVNPRERESRYIHKKLSQDIEKLVSKSQKEMNSIADEDLNEISKILKNKKANPSISLINQVEQKRNPQAVFIIKRKRKLFPSRAVDRTFPGRTRKNIRKKAVRCLQNGKRALVIPEKKTGSVNSSEKRVRPSAKNETLPRSMKKRRIAHDPATFENSSIMKRKEIDKAEWENDPLRDQNFFYNEEVIGLSRMNHRGTCKCRILNSKVPVGHDSSWEASGPLQHGSHIKFGCIEFVFCIVDHPVVFEERSYVRQKISPPSNEKISEGTKTDDLSSKLTSILSVLSSGSIEAPESLSMKSSPLRSSENHISGNEGFGIENESENFDEMSSLYSDSPSVLSDFITQRISKNKEREGDEKVLPIT